MNEADTQEVQSRKESHGEGQEPSGHDSGLETNFKKIGHGGNGQVTVINIDDKDGKITWECELEEPKVETNQTEEVEK